MKLKLTHHLNAYEIINNHTKELNKMREVEIRKNLMVREDGMVKNISVHNAVIKDWHAGSVK